MKSLFPYIAGLLLLLAGLGCQQIIEIDLPEHEPQLVVNALFTPDSSWKARVTRSQSIQVATLPQAVTNATVLILENGVVIDTLVHAIGDTFLSIADRRPVAGHTYTLRATAPGYADVSGTETVPVPVVPSSVVWLDSVVISQYGDVQGELTIAFDDPAGVHNHYLLSLVELDTFIYDLDTTIYWNNVGGNSLDPDLEYAITGGLLLDDTKFEGRHREIRIRVYDYDSGWGSGFQKTRYYVFATITESYYKYLTSLRDYYNANGNPFAEPVRMYSNLTGNMGVFAGYSAVSGEIR